MRRRTFSGSVFAGTGITGAFAAAPRAKTGTVPTRPFGRTGIQVPVIAQGGARMDLHPDVASAAAHVRAVYDLGITFFDCARSYWNGRSEEAYGIGLAGVRKQVFLTTKSTKRTRAEAEAELHTSLATLKTDYVDLWQAHDVRTQEDVNRILGPGGAMEAFRAAKKAGKCRLIGFTGHFDPDGHARMLKACREWDSVMLPLRAADHAYLSFEQGPLPIAVEQGIGIQAIKVFCKAFLLRSLSPADCLRYVLSQPAHTAVCGAGTAGQMADNIRTVVSWKPFTSAEMADVRKRAVIGQGVYTGPTLEYWKKKSS